ncbi:hypothetical protein JOD01_002640 [Brevibacillus fulvus]|uniref:Uncharacterized protein n=1 Tax=Brevibacillus fulvus TaxID=1125967 RepID=A0A938Y256_9BACL|nr:hypothetical protein [Brevibacillus fulvus]
MESNQKEQRNTPSPKALRMALQYIVTTVLPRILREDSAQEPGKSPPFLLKRDRMVHTNGNHFCRRNSQHENQAGAKRAVQRN